LAAKEGTVDYYNVYEGQFAHTRFTPPEKLLKAVEDEPCIALAVLPGSYLAEDDLIEWDNEDDILFQYGRFETVAFLRDQSRVTN
jgi:hypothetical protein